MEQALTSSFLCGLVPSKSTSCRGDTLGAGAVEEGIVPPPPPGDKDVGMAALLTGGANAVTAMLPPPFFFGEKEKRERGEGRKKVKDGTWSVVMRFEWRGIPRLQPNLLKQPSPNLPSQSVHVYDPYFFYK